ncbi:hypothetical protein TrRE_jg6679 [Triparma retinervis]|uniref:Sulfotransferase domain-containing protein n=1 Tax=Triparma retinervis TaxID=2557542 RepID=A0A9W7ARB6_9STRA|nr:hypothetical protein TrRE_jg6679 [Triparma retinervis]
MNTKAQPLLPITLPRTIEAIKSFSPGQPLTVIVASYPKSGTTWMQNVLFELVALKRFRDTGEKVDLDHISNFCPFMENDKSWVFGEDCDASGLQGNHADAHAKVGATIFNTHVYLDMMPADPGVKLIYMTRAPRDVCNSFFHHLSHQAAEDGGYEGSREEFVKDWSDGKIAFGSWGDHLRSWLNDDGTCRAGNCIRVEYEDMKADLRGVVQATARHLGMEELGGEEMEDILPRLGIEYMKANIDKFEPKSVKWVNKGDGFSFVRKGAIGDGKKEFGDGDEKVFLEGFVKFPPPGGCSGLVG